jgi:8-oxo-dGTP pyrophosphatase MutT (NUDIX family)
MRVRTDVSERQTDDRWPDPLYRIGYRVAYRCLLAWWWLRRPGARGAGVALRRDAGRLLVVRSSYRGARLSLPSGGLARGEEPRAAAVRELREELGIELAPAELREVCRLEFVFEHRRIEKTVFEPLRPTNQQPRPDRREIVWAGWLSPTEISALPMVPGLDGYLARIERDREGEGEPTPETLVRP